MAATKTRTVGDVSRIEIEGRLAVYASDVQRYAKPIVDTLIIDDTIRAQPESFLGIIIDVGASAFNTTFTVDSDYSVDGLGLGKLAKSDVKYDPRAVRKLLDKLATCQTCYGLIPRHIEEFTTAHPKLVAA